MFGKIRVVGTFGPFEEFAALANAFSDFSKCGSWAAAIGAAIGQVLDEFDASHVAPAPGNAPKERGCKVLGIKPDGLWIIGNVGRVDAATPARGVADEAIVIKAAFYIGDVGVAGDPLACLGTAFVDGRDGIHW